jgi:hypothetical protein
MATKQGAKDTLTRAPEGVAPKKSLRSGVLEQPTPHALPVGEVLEALQGQAKDAMPSSIFDDNVTTEMTPVMKRMRSEIGATAVTAKRRDPNVQASVAIEVRCDRDESGDAGRYHVRADGHVARESKEGEVDADISVSIEVNEADGCLKLDSNHVREEITNAVRATERTHLSASS